MSLFSKAMEIASNPTVQTVQAPERQRSIPAEDELQHLEPATSAAASSSLVNAQWAGGELSHDPVGAYGPSAGPSVGSGHVLSEDESSFDEFPEENLQGRGAWIRGDVDPDEEGEDADYGSLFENSDDANDDDGRNEESRDSELWPPDRSDEETESIRADDKAPGSRLLEPSQFSSDMPSPTESQLVRENFLFHRDLDDEDLAARRLDSRAFREALRDVVPDLTRKAQWYAYQQAMRHKSVASQITADFDGPSRPDGYIGRLLPDEPVSATWSSGRTVHPYGDLREVWDKVADGTYPWLARRSQELGIEPFKFGPGGNPFAGNARAKYMATTGYDLIWLAAAWDDDWDPRVKKYKPRVEQQILSKRERFFTSCSRDRIMNCSADKEQLDRLNPAAQFIYLHWPGPVPVARLALEDYRDWVEWEQNDDLGEDSAEMWSNLLRLSSEEQLTRLRLEQPFWNDFCLRNGLEEPEVYADMVEEIYEWMNEAGEDLGDEHPENHVHPHAYVGPVLYPDPEIDAFWKVKWIRWHGPGCDRERQKRETIEMLDGADGSMNYVSPATRQKQYSYLQGLDPWAVEEYAEIWKTRYHFFGEFEEEIYRRWGRPKGDEICLDWQRTVAGEDASGSSEVVNTATSRLVLPPDERYRPLTPPSDSPEPETSPRIPGLGQIEAPLDASVGLPHTGPEQAQVSRQHDNRQSTPAYTDKSLAPSTGSVEKEDVDMPDAPAYEPIVSPDVPSTPLRTAVRSLARSEVVPQPPSPEMRKKPTKMTDRKKSGKIEKPRAISVRKATSGSKVKQAVEKIEKIIVQADGSPPRRSSRIRGRKEGQKD